MTIFDELSNFAQERYAVHVGARSFSALVLSSFADTLSQSVGQRVQLQYVPYVIKLTSVNGKTNSKFMDFIRNDTHFIRDNGDYYLKVVDSLQLKFDLGVVVNDNFDTVSNITLEIHHMKFQIEASDRQLVCAPDTATLKPSFSRHKNFDSVLKRHGIDPLEMTHIEGMLLYGGLASVVRVSMAKPQAVDLPRLFPGIVFQGRIEFEISTDQKQLFVTGRRGATRHPESHCECADVGDGIGSVNRGEFVRKAEGSNRNEHVPFAGITLHGPSSVKADSVVGKRRLKREGDNGLFMPVRMAESLVNGPFPGVRFDLRDEGFIGWKAAAFIDVSDFDFEPYPTQGRFQVTLEFRVEIYGSVHIDLGKLGRIRVTTFEGEQDAAGSNSVKIGFYAVIRAGELLLKPVLEDISFGEFDIHMKLFTLVGTPFGTKGAVIGFILDRIIGELIAWQIPIRLERELRAYMARPMFPIMDAYYSAQIEGLQKTNGGTGNIQLLHALYTGCADRGFLFSTGIEG